MHPSEPASMVYCMPLPYIVQVRGFPLEPISLPCPVNSVPDVQSRKRKSKHDKLDEEPRPATTFLLARHAASALWRRGTRSACGVAPGVLLVQIVRFDGNDVVVVAEFTSLGGEAQVSNGWDLELRNFEALRPFIFCFVLEFEAEVFVLEVGEASFGSNLGVADTAGGASSDFVGLAIIALVVGCFSVSVHGHDVGEHGARTIVLIGVKEDTQTLKVVGVTEDISWLCALFGEPHGKAIAEQVALSMDLELD